MDFKTSTLCSNNNHTGRNKVFTKSITEEHKFEVCNNVIISEVGFVRSPKEREVRKETKMKNNTPFGLKCPTIVYISLASNVPIVRKQRKYVINDELEQHLLFRGHSLYTEILFINVIDRSFSGFFHSTWFVILL